MMKIRFVEPYNEEVSYMAILEADFKRMRQAQYQYVALTRYMYHPGHFEEAFDNEKYMMINAFREHDKQCFDSWINALKIDDDETDELVYKRLSLSDLIDYEVDIADYF